MLCLLTLCESDRLIEEGGRVVCLLVLVKHSDSQLQGEGRRQKVQLVKAGLLYEGSAII